MNYKFTVMDICPVLMPKYAALRGTKILIIDSVNKAQTTIIGAESNSESRMFFGSHSGVQLSLTKLACLSLFVLGIPITNFVENTPF